MRRWVALASILPAVLPAVPATAIPGVSPARAASSPVRAAYGPVRAASGPARAAVSPARADGMVRPGRRKITIGRYVALGDSFTAGPLIPHRKGRPIACLRSDHNYPSLVARALRPTAFTDVSCSAATIADLTHAQHVLFSENAPQLDAVRPDTALVTLGIGGNDVGYTRTILTCALLSLTAPSGAPCRKHYGDSLNGRITDAAPRLGAALREIHNRAPRARVVVVGYPRVLPARTGCWPAVPTASGDVGFLDGIERRLNHMLAAEARRNDATFVDAYRSAARHDMCAADKWIEGIVIKSPAAPVHPNAEGMRAVADRVLATLGASTT